MPWDEGLAHLLREDLAAEPVVEKKMFGGLAFLVGGHMVCGLHKGGVFFRVGKPHEAEALTLPGVQPMTMAGRPMPGMVACSDETSADDARRARLIALSLGFVRSLPPK